MPCQRWKENNIESYICAKSYNDNDNEIRSFSGSPSIDVYNMNIKTSYFSAVFVSTSSVATYYLSPTSLESAESVDHVTWDGDD